MRHRRVTLQALVGPGHVIILFDERMQEPFQMTLAQHDHMVKELSPQRSDESLDERICLRCRLHPVGTMRQECFASSIPFIRSVASNWRW